MTPEVGRDYFVHWYETLDNIYEVKCIGVEGGEGKFIFYREHCGYKCLPEQRIVCARHRDPQVVALPGTPQTDRSFLWLILTLLGILATVLIALPVGIALANLICEGTFK